MVKKKETVHIIATGGTIDSFYDGTKDTVVPNEHSIIPEYLKSLKLYENIEFSEVCMRDSRSLTTADLQNLTKTIKESPHKHIIITHGTYTMPDTGRFLKANLKRDDQTIILTGSMIPIAGFTASDGPFNLGYSIAKVQELPPGIHVCMNGEIFTPEEVMKLISEGRFSSIFGEK